VGAHAYVTSDGHDTVSVIDTTTNTETAVITGFNGPQGVAIAPIKPSLTITKTHTGAFTAGRVGVYTITVGNNGAAPTDGTTVTVQDTLPPELTVTSLTGSGWRCTRSTLTCTRSNVLAVGSSYPPITLRVRVARTATGTVTNTATVSGAATAPLPPRTRLSSTRIRGATPSRATTRPTARSSSRGGREGRPAPAVDGRACPPGVWRTTAKYSNRRNRSRPTPPASERLISRADFSDRPAHSSHRGAASRNAGTGRRSQPMSVAPQA
ncbi:hypothetical protein ACWGLF_03250, partial [Streptomyces puniciscabiei]